MRDQYSGDISDFVKFALLRALASNKAVAIWWYYIAGHDGRKDGHHKEWADDPRFATLDRELFDVLASFAKGPEHSRTVRGLEELQLLPVGTMFFPSGDSYLEHQVPSMNERTSWLEFKLRQINECSLVFLDPDNGVHLVDREPSRKHASLRDVRALLEKGKSICYITFPHRNAKHEEQLQIKHGILEALAPGRQVMTLRTVVNVPKKLQRGTSPRIRWFTLVTDDQNLVDAMCRFASHIDTQPPKTISAKLYPATISL